MKLCISKQRLLMEHKKRTLDFGDFKPNPRGARGKDYGPEAFIKTLSNALFIEINNYWATFSPERAEALFIAYEEAHEDLLNARTDVERQQYLVDCVEKITHEFCKYDELHEFMSTQHVVPSSKVTEEFDDSIDMLSRRTTYIKEDYGHLATLTVAIRSIMPLWNLLNYNYATPSARAKNVYYEMDMFRSMKNSSVANSRPYLRLKDYIDAIWDKNVNGKNKAKSKDAILSSVVAGLGTSDIPIMLYATSIVNKLAYREVNSFRDSGDLITHVYQRLDSEIKKLHSKFANIKAKKAISKAEEEDKTGYLESFRTRELTRRDVALVNQVYLDKWRQAAKNLDGEIPIALVRACIESLKQYRPMPIRADQEYLVKLVLYKITVAKAIPNIERPEMINALGITAAVLIHWRLRGIAALIFAHPDNNADEDELITTPFDTPSVELRARLSKIYPCKRYSRGTAAKRSLCPGFNAVDELSKFYADQYWELECTEAIAEELRQEPGKFKPTRTLKTELAEMFIHLASINKDGTGNSDIMPVRIITG